MAVVLSREDGSVNRIVAGENVRVSDFGVTWDQVPFVNRVPGEEGDTEGVEGDGAVRHV